MPSAISASTALLWLANKKSCNDCTKAAEDLPDSPPVVPASALSSTLTRCSRVTSEPEERTRPCKPRCSREGQGRNEVRMSCRQAQSTSLAVYIIITSAGFTRSVLAEAAVAIQVRRWPKLSAAVEWRPSEFSWFTCRVGQTPTKM